MGALPQPLDFMVGLGIAFYIVKLMIDYTPKIRAFFGTNGRHSDNRAGERDTTFWQLEHRRAIAEVVAPMFQGQEAILKKLSESVDRQAHAFEQHAASQRQLADEIRREMAEERGRRDRRR